MTQEAAHHKKEKYGAGKKETTPPTKKAQKAFWNRREGKSLPKNETVAKRGRRL